MPRHDPQHHHKDPYYASHPKPARKGKPRKPKPTASHGSRHSPTVKAPKTPRIGPEPHGPPAPKSPGHSGGSGHHTKAPKLIPTLGEYDVPGKTTVWNHRHHVRISLATIASHRSPK